jgi:hypothetical protein
VEIVLQWNLLAVMREDTQPAALDIDVELMLGFQAGDLQAFEKLFSRHARSVVNFANRFVRNREVATSPIPLQANATRSALSISSRVGGWFLCRRSHNEDAKTLRKLTIFRNAWHDFRQHFPLRAPFRFNRTEGRTKSCPKPD